MTESSDWGTTWASWQAALFQGTNTSTTAARQPGLSLEEVSPGQHDNTDDRRGSTSRSRSMSVSSMASSQQENVPMSSFIDRESVRSRSAQNKSRRTRDENNPFLYSNVLVEKTGQFPRSKSVSRSVRSPTGAVSQMNRPPSGLAPSRSRSLERIPSNQSQNQSVEGKKVPESSAQRNRSKSPFPRRNASNLRSTAARNTSQKEDSRSSLPSPDSTIQFGKARSEFSVLPKITSKNAVESIRLRDSGAEAKDKPQQQPESSQPSSTWVKPKPLSRPVQARLSPTAKTSKNRMQQMIRSLSPRRLRSGHVKQKESAPFFGRLDKDPLERHHGKTDRENSALQPPIENSLSGSGTSLSMTSVLKASPSFRRSTSMSRKRSDPRQITENQSVQPLVTSKLSLEDMDVLPQSLSEASMTARDSSVLDSPTQHRNGPVKRGVVTNPGHSIHTNAGKTSDRAPQEHVSKDKKFESWRSTESFSPARPVKKNPSKSKEELLDHNRNLVEVDASRYQAEATLTLQSPNQKDGPVPKKDIRRPFSPERQSKTQNEEPERIAILDQSNLAEKSSSHRVNKSWKAGIIRQFRRASSRSPRRTRNDTDEEFPTYLSNTNNPAEKESARAPVDLPENSHQLYRKASRNNEASLLKMKNKNVSREKPVHRQQIVFNEFDVSTSPEKSKSFSSLNTRSSLDSLSLLKTSEVTSRANKDDTGKCFVRLTPHTLSGVMTEKIRWKSSKSNILVHGMVAHVQEDGSIESPASIALSQPITPVVETMKTSSYNLAWSYPAADSTKGRIYFSVPFSSDAKAPDQEIVVGIKRGHEMIQLGYASVPVSGRPVSGRAVEIDIVPFDSKKRGIFSKRSDVFENDDKVYKLGPIAVLRATLDIKYDQRRQASCPVDEGSLVGERNDVLVQPKPDKLTLSNSGAQSQSSYETKQAENTPSVENLALGESPPVKEGANVINADILPSLDIARILSGIVSWRSEHADEETTQEQMTPLASGLMSPELKDWYSPTYKSKKTGKMDFNAGSAPEDDASRITGQTNTEKMEDEKTPCNEDYQEFVKEEAEKKVVHEIIPAEPPSISQNRSVSDPLSDSTTLETNEDSFSLPTLANTRSVDYISMSSGLSDARVLTHVIEMCAGGSAPVLSHVGPYRLTAGQTLKVIPQPKSSETLLNTHHLSFDASGNNDSVTTGPRKTLDIEHAKLTGSELGSTSGTFDNSAISAITDYAEQKVEQEQESTVESQPRSLEEQSNPKVEEPLDTDLVKFAIELEKARTRQTSNKVKEVDGSDLESHPVTTSSRNNDTAERGTNSNQWDDAARVGRNANNNVEDDLPFDCQESGNIVEESLTPTHSGDEQELLRILSGFSNGSQHENQLLPATRQSKARPRPEDMMSPGSKPTWSRHSAWKQEGNTGYSILTGVRFPRKPSLNDADSGIVESPSMENVGPSFDSHHGTDCLGGAVESVFASLFGKTEMKTISNGESRDPIIEEDADDYAFQEMSLSSNHSYGPRFSHDESFSRTLPEYHNQHEFEKRAVLSLEQQNLDATDSVRQEPLHLPGIESKKGGEQMYPADEYLPSTGMTLPSEEGFETILYNFDEYGSMKSSRKKGKKESKRRMKRLSQQRKKSKARAPLANKRLERLRPEQNFGLRTVEGFNSPRIQSTTDASLVTKLSSKAKRHVKWERPPFLETSPRSDDLSALSFEFSENGTTRRITDILEELSDSPSHQDSTSPSELRHRPSNVSNSWSQEEEENNEDLEKHGPVVNDGQPMDQRKDVEYEKATQRLLQLSRKLGVTPEALLNQLDTP